MYGRRAGKVMKAQLSQPAASPDPVPRYRIDHCRDHEGIDTIGNEYKFPIIKSNNFGHIDRKTVIPIGTMAEINTNNEIN